MRPQNDLTDNEPPQRSSVSVDRAQAAEDEAVCADRQLADAELASPNEPAPGECEGSLTDPASRFRVYLDDPRIDAGAKAILRGAGPAREHMLQVQSARASRAPGDIIEYSLDQAEGQPDGLMSLPLLGRDGVIFVGWSHLLAAGVRVGKTELLVHAVIAWLRRGLGVRWFSEEPESAWADRRDELRALHGPSLPLNRLTIVHAVGADPRALLDRAQSSAETIVIADTLRHVCGIEDENDAAAVRKGVAPWVGLTQAGKTLIGVVHHRKEQTDDAVRAVAGSHALPALFDVVLELRPDTQKQRRRLAGIGRRVEIPTLVVERDEDGRMYVVGDGRSVSAKQLEEECLDALRAAAEPLTTIQVHRGLGERPPAVRSVQRALDRLARRGAVIREPGLDEDVERRRVTWSLADPETATPSAPPVVAEPEFEYSDAATESRSLGNRDLLSQSQLPRVAGGAASALLDGVLEAFPGADTVGRAAS